ncbi:hypothetical protein AB0D11_18545 [Streptomyces monashensis]|uniref:hypothetical protein n=1 Tax=Streptomyces monashensis TaxID=1678012 RepID=UPI0033DC7C5A
MGRDTFDAGLESLRPRGVTTGHEHTHNISKSKYGHLQHGSRGYNVTWKRCRSNAKTCGGVEIAHGSATPPTSETGW